MWDICTLNISRVVRTHAESMHGICAPRKYATIDFRLRIFAAVSLPRSYTTYLRVKHICGILVPRAYLGFPTSEPVYKLQVTYYEAILHITTSHITVGIRRITYIYIDEHKLI